MDYPTYQVAIDRTKASQGGYAARDVGQSILNTLSGSFQITPMFFLNWKNGVNYQPGRPDSAIQDGLHQDLQNIPINVAPALQQPRKFWPISHPSIEATRWQSSRVQHAPRGRHLRRSAGARPRRGGRDVERIVDASKSYLPSGTFVAFCGQIDTMRSSYVSLLGGLALSPSSSSTC